VWKVTPWGQFSWAPHTGGDNASSLLSVYFWTCSPAEDVVHDAAAAASSMDHRTVPLRWTVLNERNAGVGMQNERHS